MKEARLKKKHYAIYIKFSEKANLWRPRAAQWLPGVGVGTGVADKLRTCVSKNSFIEVHTMN